MKVYDTTEVNASLLKYKMKPHKHLGSSGDKELSKEPALSLYLQVFQEILLQTHTIELNKNQKTLSTGATRFPVESTRQCQAPMRNINSYNNSSCVNDMLKTAF